MKLDTAIESIGTKLNDGTKTVARILTKTYEILGHPEYKLTEDSNLPQLVKDMVQVMLAGTYDINPSFTLEGVNIKELHICPTKKDKMNYAYTYGKKISRKEFIEAQIQAKEIVSKLVYKFEDENKTMAPNSLFDASDIQYLFDQALEESEGVDFLKDINKHILATSLFEYNEKK